MKSQADGKQAADWYEKVFDELYPLLYKHRNLEEARLLVDRLAARVAFDGTRVLDLGCGTGRFTRALGDRGVATVGLDLSMPLLARARSGSPGAALIRGDMRAVPVRAASVDWVLMMFTTFGYFDTIAEDASVLGEASRVLAPGGRLLLDYVNASHVHANLIERSGRMVCGIPIAERRWIDPSGPFVMKETNVGPLKSGEIRRYRERLRLYTPGQIDEMLAATGLEPVERWGGYHLQPFESESSERLLLVARQGEPRR